MSTLKVTNIQDTSGSNSSTSAEIYTGRAKAWVNFNGQGTVSTRADFNVNTITDNATGDYTVNFSTPFADTNYCITEGHSTSNGMYMEYATNILDRPSGVHTDPTTGSFRCTTYGQGAFRDPNAMFFAVFR